VVWPALKPIKDYVTLLTAFAVMCKKIDARILILGEGECRAELEAQIKNLGLENSVFMPGFIKNLTSYYQRADLHVLSSSGEGFGNVIVEALAAGTPVVSTDCQSGPREILADGRFGMLVPVGDAVALANAMAKSLAIKHNCSDLKARAKVFSIDKAVDSYLKLLLPSSSTEGAA
jgi:glycosyltransferase involved in cell wall biosynthesis